MKTKNLKSTYHKYSCSFSILERSHNNQSWEKSKGLLRLKRACDVKLVSEKPI